MTPLTSRIPARARRAILLCTYVDSRSQVFRRPSGPGSGATSSLPGVRTATRPEVGCTVSAGMGLPTTRVPLPLPQFRRRRGHDVMPHRQPHPGADVQRKRQMLLAHAVVCDLVRCNIRRNGRGASPRPNADSAAGPIVYPSPRRPGNGWHVAGLCQQDRWGQRGTRAGIISLRDTS